MVKQMLFIALSSVIFSSSSLAQSINWQSPIDIASNSSGNNYPRIVADAQGNPLVIWGGSANLMFSRWDVDSFTTPIILNTDGVKIAQATWMGPDIAASGNTVYVVYKQLPEGSPNSHIWCRRSDDGGKSFNEAVRVDYIGDSLSRFAHVAVDNQANPIVAFMKFDDNFNDAHWVVARSSDKGQSFKTEVLAGNWSSATAEACDCCPASITSSDNNLAIVYRDNNNNLRDVWAGFSTDTGNTFDFGADIDKGNWQIFSCPASGPDAIIINDSLYTTFLSGSSGSYRVYLSKTALSDGASTGAIRIKADYAGISKQNFPRIANSDGRVAMVWQEVASGKSKLELSLTANITQKNSNLIETVADDHVSSGDVYVHQNKLYCVWQDNNSGTVKFRAGDFSQALSIQKLQQQPLNIYPNPSSNAWNIEISNTNSSYELVDTRGQLIKKSELKLGINQLNNDKLAAGIYLLKVQTGTTIQTYRLIKS